MPTPDSFTLEATVPITIHAKVVVSAGQVHVLDAYFQDDFLTTPISRLGQAAYVKLLETIAAEARERDRKRAMEDFDARR